jgi:hypothetical protein
MLGGYLFAGPLSTTGGPVLTLLLLASCTHEGRNTRRERRSEGRAALAKGRADSPPSHSGGGNGFRPSLRRTARSQFLGYGLGSG